MARVREDKARTRCNRAIWVECVEGQPFSSMYPCDRYPHNSGLHEATINGFVGERWRIRAASYQSYEAAAAIGGLARPFKPAPHTLASDTGQLR